MPPPGTIGTILVYVPLDTMMMGLMLNAKVIHFSLLIKLVIPRYQFARPIILVHVRIRRCTCSTQLATDVLAIVGTFTIRQLMIAKVSYY